MVAAILIFKLFSLESLNLMSDDRKLLQNEESFVIVLTDSDDDKKFECSNHISYQFPSL